jgi:hypothetical protein
VLQTLNENHIPYAVIGGLATAHHGIPRLTQDVDIALLSEDAGRMRSLFPGCYRRGTRVVETYEIEGVRVDILPARLRFERAVVENAIEGDIEGVPAKIAAVRDLLLLKTMAAPERDELSKRRADEADITGILESNRETVTAADIRYVGDRMLELCYTAETRQRTIAQLQWLNDTLDQLGMSDRVYPLPK